MPAKDSETITKWYDALSKNYDELYGEEQDKKHAKVLQLLGDREFKIIVDVGCGTGRLLELISQRSQFGLGIDLSLQMLNKAKQRKTDSSIQLVRADASHLPLQGHIADGVTSVSMTESGPTLEEQRKQLDERSIELVVELSDREQLYLLDGSKHQVRASSESSALV